MLAQHSATLIGINFDKTNISRQIKTEKFVYTGIDHHFYHYFHIHYLHYAVFATIVTLCGHFCHLYFDEAPDTLVA